MVRRGEGDSVSIYLYLRPTRVPMRASHLPFWCSVTPRNWEEFWWLPATTLTLSALCPPPHPFSGVSST